jgi:FkbM family methyltransferase
MLKRMIAGSNILRAITFPLLRHLNFEIEVRHDITKRPLRILSWSHKGYWFYGLSREEEEIDRFRELITEGSVILEIGGHIGYLTQLFEELVGDDGKVYVAEPSPNSLYFLNKNVLSSTCVVPIALSDTVGRSNLYTDSFGGFTNSLIRDFTEDSNASMSLSQKNRNVAVGNIEVDVTTVDALCKDLLVSPNFIKIDVEGAELSVLKGAKNTLMSVDNLMVEISRNHEEVFTLLYRAGFHATTKNGESLEVGDYRDGNIFFSRAS